jgi:hypothetical protein
MKTLAILASLFFVASQSPAKVLIYKGTLHSKTGILDTRPAVSSLFVLINPESKKIALLRFFREGGEGKLSTGLLAPLNFASPDLPEGKSATTISFAFSSVTDADNFSDGLFYMRGPNKTLRFNSLADSVTTTVNFPRIFTGISFQVFGQSGPGDKFLEEKVALIYQELRTVTANNADQSIETASVSLVQELNAKGFED